jgi:uncharacterized protein YjeT (DUF2065 family)
MISAVIATLGFLILVEGILVSLMTKDIKKFMKEIAKNRKGEKTLRKIGLWEVLIGLLLLITAILTRNL